MQMFNVVCLPDLMTLLKMSFLIIVEQFATLKTIPVLYSVMVLGRRNVLTL
jgi:hypothetical protein